MGKFSDSPYWLLKGFFANEGGHLYNVLGRPINDYQWPVIWTDRDYVTFSDRPGVFWNLRWYYDPNIEQTDGSYLVGPETNIVTAGDGIMELWVKETEDLDVPSGHALEGRGKEFLPIYLRFQKIEDDRFIFTDSDIHNLQPGLSANIITPFPLAEPRYQFVNFDTTDLDYFSYIENNREVYFRKDSLYHQWLKDTVQGAPAVYPVLRGHETDIRNYVNTDTIWNYFGKIFKYQQGNTGKDQTASNEFRIIFDGLQEYVMRAIPEHQRTTKFDEFCKVFFDQKWHETYNLIKNIWTLIDPMEVDEDFLGYLSLYYHMYDLISPTLFRQREFVRDLIWLLKRKGTYIEFYIIWRVIANTINTLNIYEKWHERDIWYGTHTLPSTPASMDGDTHVGAGEWQGYIYGEKPEYRFSAPIGGAGRGWYNRTYDLSGNSVVSTLSPSGFYNYPVKLDNDTTPDGYGTSNADIPLNTYLEDSRILSTHYKVEIDVSNEPLLPNAIVNKVMWDELWQYWDFLRPVNRVVDYNILIAPITDFSGCWVSLYDGTPAYDLTKILVDMRTPTGWISPFTEGEPMSGCIGYAGAGISPSGGCTWIVDHDLNSKYLHTMAVDKEFNQIIPASIEIVDNNTVIFYFETPTFGYAVLKKSQVHGYGSADTPWKLYHYMNQTEITIDTVPASGGGLIIETHEHGFGDPNVKMWSNNIELSDIDYATIDTQDAPGTIVPASSGAYTFIQPIGSESDTWDIPHRLYYRGVILGVYDWNHNQIVQYNLELDGIHRCQLKFDTPISGYAVLIPVANFSLEQLIDDFMDLFGDNSLWRGGTQIGNLANDTFAASGAIEQTEIYEDEEFIYINIKLEADVEGSFREWGLYNDEGDMVVYSKNSEIYKPAGTTLVLHFRLEKTANGSCGSGDSKAVRTC